MSVIWSLEVTVSMRYDETGRIVACGVTTPNYQGWHPRVNASFMNAAQPLFPEKLPRAAMRLAKAAQRAKAKSSSAGDGHAGDVGTNHVAVQP